ncbi:hypothetical protein N665_0236s0049 [Sinapis alba]|nr:hypothetical protein N665_0236s0049 [Sinapis alba]
MKTAKFENEEFMYPDRISHLSDDLLLRILSSVHVRTAKFVMSTSLLSKRWRYVWKMMPTLVYEETCPLRFEQFCVMSLPLHEALKTLNLKLTRCSGSKDTLSFPNIPSSLLEITITLNYYSPMRFPKKLNVFKTLLVLKLQGMIVLDFVDSPICFPSLKILHLTRVKFDHKESFKRVLLACPVLEDLFLRNFCEAGLFLFTISSPSLQRLSIDTASSSCYGLDDPRFEINTPFLNYLEIVDRRGHYNFLEDMPKLVEANISVHGPKKIEKLMKVLTSLEHLSLTLYPSMSSHLKGTLISKRILHLDLRINDANKFSLIMYLLEGFPKLRSLKLTKVSWLFNRDIEDQPSSVPECLSFHLETLEWIGYEGTLEEKQVATFILKNAHCLKTATFSLHSRDTEKRMLIVNDLLSMTKASASCQLVIY